MEHQLTNYRGKRVVVLLSTGTCLMGTIHWIQDDGSVFGLSDGAADDADLVVTRYVVSLREMKS